MKKFIALFMLAALPALAQTNWTYSTNLFYAEPAPVLIYIGTNGTDGGGYDAHHWAGAINHNSTWLNGQIAAVNNSFTNFLATNAPSGGGVSAATVTNIATTVATNLIMISSNGVVGWVNAQNYITALTTNIARTSQRQVFFSTNAFLMSGSNYIGRFPHFYQAALQVPVWTDSANLPHNFPEQIWGSYTGTNNWFQVVTNGAPFNGVWTNISLSVVGTNSTGIGAVTIYGLDHPELHGNVISYDGQSLLIDGSPAASIADLTATIHVFQSPVQMSDSWIIYSGTATNANYISFTDHGNEIFKLISSSVGLNQAAGGWDATGTNILLLTTNLPGGWFLETCTNITPPVTWNQTTNYTLSTNTGVITFTIPVNFSLTTCFFRLRTGASVGAIFSAPVSFNGGTIYPSNSWNLTTITNALASLGAGKHYWLGNSNGQALVTLSYSNGVVRYIRADN